MKDLHLRKIFKAEIVDILDGEEAGIKSATLRISVNLLLAI